MAPGSVRLGDSCRVLGLPRHLGWREGKLGPLPPLAAPLGGWWVTEEPAEP